MNKIKKEFIELLKTKSYKLKAGGFTLLEMIVAIGVFSIAILISISTFLNLQSAEKKIQAAVNLQNNLRFVLEIMAKEIRTGQDYHCGETPGLEPLDCLSGDSAIKFRNASGQDTIYRKSGSVIQKSTDGGNIFQPLTAGDISVEELKFYVIGAPAGDGLQPRVVITLRAFAEVGADKKELTLQTAASQRKFAP